MQGKVKRFNKVKGFGFITADDGRDVITFKAIIMQNRCVVYRLLISARIIRLRNNNALRQGYKRAFI